ncbi:hypothetical protein [Amycolatopsis australiensis]|uniref:Tetratricopeptide repeat-containing protein n=1 Tax=Amycolatopsis australiensis TaxID=546364 RepID=A0A1K1LVT1_9PSEU|nr:hypothetical protein [Amycolatopsis australiensis]SFW13774.1 hypothetical protein SAMN04489730_0186 [Amycolatopsis australiensis]
MSDPHDHRPTAATVQRVFEVLVDHPGPTTTAAPLAAALELPEPTVIAALQRLRANDHVVRPPEGRHTLPEGDRRYALAPGVSRHAAHLRGRVPPSIRTQQRTRLLHWYAATAEVAVPLAFDAHRFSPPVTHAAVARRAGRWDPLGWFAWEHDVLRNVIATLVDWKHDEVVIGLAEAMWHLGRPTYHHHDLLHAQQAGRTAAERAHPALAPMFQAREAAVLADLAHHEDALAAVDDAVRRLDEHTDRLIRETVLSTRGRVQLAAGDTDHALRSFTAAHSYHRRLVDDYGKATLLRRIGQTHLANLQTDKAIKCLKDACAAMPRIPLAGSSLARVRAITHLANALTTGGRASEARRRLDRTHPLIKGTVATRYRAGHDLAVARATYALNDTAVTRNLTDNLIAQLELAGPGAARDLHAARDLRRRL